MKVKFFNAERFKELDRSYQVDLIRIAISFILVVFAVILILK